MHIYIDMVMRAKRLTVAIHALVWLLLLVVPYISTDQIFSLLDPEADVKYLLLCFTISCVLLTTFYINYFFLIPKFLFSKKNWLYILFLLLMIILVLVTPSILFYFSDFNPLKLTDTSMIVEKIIPVIMINSLVLWLLSIGFSILWTFYNRLKQAENEKLSAQIASLKSQINPHFLFNTLNNIYATVIDTSPKAADMVDKLSEMMRYTMKDTHQDVVLLEDEINYVSNYIELQRIRLDENVDLEYNCMNNIPNLQIAPMLLIPFIENAFKYGVNSEQNSRIKIDVAINKQRLLLSVVNNKVIIQKNIYEKSGLGIENTMRRLELIYPSKHLLEIDNSENQFSVLLNIDLQ